MKKILAALFFFSCILGFSQSLDLPANINRAIVTAKAQSIEPAVKSFVLERGNRSLKEIALTIDDGYNHDDRILDLLQSYNIKPTIFIVGAIVHLNPDFIKRMDSMGWEIGNHTYTHPWMTKVDNRQLSVEIKSTEKIIRETIGKEPVKYFRPPWGSYNPRVLEDISFDSYKIILWNDEIQDWIKNITVEEQVKHGLTYLDNGAILLCHFGGYNTYEALKALIPEILSRGYKFVTISEMIDHLTVKPEGEKNG